MFGLTNRKHKTAAYISAMAVQLNDLLELIVASGGIASINERYASEVHYKTGTTVRVVKANRGDIYQMDAYQLELTRDDVTRTVPMLTLSVYGPGKHITNLSLPNLLHPADVKKGLIRTHPALRAIATDVNLHHSLVDVNYELPLPEFYKAVKTAGYVKMGPERVSVSMCDTLICTPRVNNNGEHVWDISLFDGDLKPIRNMAGCKSVTVHDCEPKRGTNSQ